MSLRAVAGDAAATGAFVLFSSIWEDLAGIVAAYGVPPLTAGIAVVIAGLALFDPVSQMLGGHGVSFNPATSACFAAAGRGSWASHALRMVGQTVGAVLGAFAAYRLVPSAWQSSFGHQGGELGKGYTLLGGLGCEAALTGLVHLSILWAVSMQNKTAGFSTPLVATAPLVYLGTGVTGLSMNPAVTAGWVAWHRGQGLAEHLVVDWADPILGAAAAGWLWRWGTAPSARRKRAGKPGNGVRSPNGRPKSARAAKGSPGKKSAAAKKAE